MTIVRARPEDAEKLTDIAFAAKRHWGYAEIWIERWTELLTLRPEFITRHETYIAKQDERAVGFYALGRKDSRLELVHMWVVPDAMGQGMGRSLFLHAVERGRSLGFSEIEIESDPNAEGFYRRMGARWIGSRVQESERQRRELPILVYEIAGA